jgi:hypothetical protein
LRPLPTKIMLICQRVHQINLQGRHQIKRRISHFPRHSFLIYVVPASCESEGICQLYQSRPKYSTWLNRPDLLYPGSFVKNNLISVRLFDWVFCAEQLVESIAVVVDHDKLATTPEDRIKVGVVLRSADLGPRGSIKCLNVNVESESFRMVCS